MTEETTVEPISAPSTELPATIDTDAVVLPREIDINGRGLYDDSVITIAKELRSEGATASYQHDQASRGWIGEDGLAVIVLDLAIGIASNAGWSALSRVLRKNHPDDRVRVRVARFRKTGPNVGLDWFKVEGSGADVARALDAIQGRTQEAPELGEETQDEAQHE